jgi:predicted N-acetyltransferase YhbS
MRLTDESLLEGDVRRRIGAILREVFAVDDRAVRERGWIQHVPTFRMIVEVDGEVVGQQAVMTLRSTPLVHGLGDMAILPTYRGRSLASEAIRNAVSESRRRGAQHIITATRHPYLLPLFRELGFAPVPPWQCWYSTPLACVRDPDWLAWSRQERLPKLELSGPF